MELSKEAKEARAAYQREWRKNNPEKSKEYAQRWREKNRQIENTRRRRWEKNNPEKHRSESRKMQTRYWERKAAAMHQQSSDPNTSDADTVESKANEDMNSIDERGINGQEHN